MLFLFKPKKNYEIFIEFSKNSNGYEIKYFQSNIETISFGKKYLNYSSYNYFKIEYKKTPKFDLIIKEQKDLNYMFLNVSELEFNSFPYTMIECGFQRIKSLSLVKPLYYDYAVILIENKASANIPLELIDKSDNTKTLSNNIYNKFDESIVYSLYFYTGGQSELLSLTYNFTSKSNRRIIIKRVEEAGGLDLDMTKANGVKNFFLVSNKKYNVSCKNLNESDINSGQFKLEIVTGIIHKIDPAQEKLEFKKYNLTSKTSPLTLYFNSKQKNYFKKFEAINGEELGEISILQNHEKSRRILRNNHYYYFEKGNNDYNIQVKFIQKGNNYLLNSFRLVEFSENNILKLSESKTITYKEANTDKFILCDFTQTSIFSVKVASGSATINVASVYDYQFSNFPINIDYIKFEKVENKSYEIKKIALRKYI